MNRKMVILTEGHSNPRTAKTACSVIRYRPDEVVAVLDSAQAGKTTQEVLQVGGELPFIRDLGEADHADTLLVGIAPPGGKIPASWRAIVVNALTQGMDVISGLHEFLGDDTEFAKVATQSGAKIWDVRKNDEKEIAQCKALDESCFRVLTVGNDCGVGKMVTAIEINAELKRQGVDAKFVATGQTGIMVEGDGCPIDCVVADFVSGAAERLVLDRQHHDLLMIEGQGSLAHLAYSTVTLGLLHGTAPHAMILGYEVGRHEMTSLNHRQIPALDKILRAFEMMANLRHPSQVIGVSMNSRLLTQDEATREKAYIEEQFGLPVCDVFRDGPEILANEVLRRYLKHRETYPR